MRAISQLGARLPFWCDRWISRATTIAASMLARLYGVDVGVGTRFSGLPILRRVPGARTVIGNHCDLRSHPRFNLSGVRSRVSISALRPGALLRIGDGCGLSGTVIVALQEVVLGDRVMCGANTYIYDSDMHGIRHDRRDDPSIRPVRIDDDVWLGLNVVVLKGVHIGARTVVAAGSVVSRSLPADHLCAGIPAHPIRRIT